MKTSQRGAARISAVWLIVAIVLLIAAVGFAYIASDDASVQRKNATDATTAAKAAEDKFQAEITKTLEVSAVLGFAANETTPSNLVAASESLESLKSAFPDAQVAETFQDVVPIAISGYAQKVAEIGTLNGRITDLQSQLKAARDSEQTVAGEKDGRIAELQSQLNDLQANSQSEISRLEGSVADLRTESNQIDANLKTQRAATDDVERALADQEARAQTTKRSYTKRLDDIERRSEQPDGEVLHVSDALGIGYINLGAEDRLSEGTRFRVVSGQPGADASEAKAFALVTNVGPTRSEITITDQRDPFLPVVSGDKLYNPLYEPKGERFAVLAGRFSGAWNEKELRYLLDGIGIKIQDSIDLNSDFLIVGSELFVDEDGEPVEEPIPVSDLGVYKDAQAQGVTIVPIRDVRQYFRK